MNLKYVMVFCALAVMTTGCNESKFLDIRPQGTLNDENLTSAKGAEMLMNAAYAALAGPGENRNDVRNYPMTNWSYGEVRADNAYKGGRGVGDVSDIHKLETFDVDASLANVDGKWFQLYCCVQRCNFALRALQNLTDGEMADRTVRIAEMKVLRAHFFFELSRLYNKIPYFDETLDESKDYTDVTNNQYTRDQILGMIAKELTDAAEVLPERQTDLGRVNCYVAWAYAAKVKLYQAYEQDETTHKVVKVNSELMREVVDLCSKLDGKYDLLSDFQQLDLVAYENGQESVFAVQYILNDASGEMLCINWSNLLNAPGGEAYKGDSFFLPSQNLINAYKTDDNGFPLFDTFNEEDYSVPGTDDKGNFINTQIESNVDPRLDFVVGRPNIRWKTYTKTPCQQSWVNDQSTYGSNCVKRFFVSPESEDMCKEWPWGASGLNWQIIRYAHVLLWKAEALIELGDAASLEQARKVINRIRHRAATSVWVKDFKNPDKDAANYKISEYPAAGWTQDYARKALRFETRLETALEGERFFDLVRWGEASNTLRKYLEVEQNKRIYYKGVQFVAGRDEYLPISIGQYTLSGGIYVQNPGYSQFN